MLAVLSDACAALCSNLAGQQLAGQLPLDQRVWGALPEVTSVNLNNNAIQGYVPPQLDQLGHVQNLNLGNNGFQGPLPNLSNLSSVENVTFSNNQLTGELLVFGSGPHSREELTNHLK